MTKPADFHASGSVPVALLVDGENMGAKWADAILREAGHYGPPTVRRVYGKLDHIADWADHGFRLQPTRPGKNSADMLLAVEAMSLALREAFHTVLIASSDRDFSYLVEHLRELGHHVVGIGEVKAPQAFRACCSEFIELIDAAQRQTGPQQATEPRIPATKIIPLVRDIIPRSSLKDGWAYLDWVEKTLTSADETFTAASYGHATLGDLVRAVNFFEIAPAANGKVKLRDPTKTPKPAQPATP